MTEFVDSFFFLFIVIVVGVIVTEREDERWRRQIIHSFIHSSLKSNLSILFQQFIFFHFSSVQIAYIEYVHQMDRNRTFGWLIIVEKNIVTLYNGSELH